MAEDDAPWSTLGFAEEAAIFTGPTRNARVLSEGWVAAKAFCPSCGATPLTAFAVNAPVADFHCGVCAEDYELKATKGRAFAEPFRLRFASAPLRPPVSLRSPEDDESGRPEFSLAEVYGFEARLSAIYPGNNNVRPKIRQQLQAPRDMGWLEFGGRGTYRRT